MPLKPETKTRWAERYRNNNAVPKLAGTLALILGAVVLVDHELPADKPPAAVSQPAANAMPKLHSLAQPLFLWNDYRYKNGMDVNVENGRGVDCGSEPAPTTDGRKIPGPFPEADMWPGFQFQEGTSNFGEFQNGDRLLFIGRENAVGNDADQFLTDGWAMEYYKATSTYRVFHFIVKKAADLHFPAVGSAPAENLPRADAFADAESPLLTRQDLQHGVFYNDEHTSVWAGLDVWKGNPDSGYGSRPQPHFTVACNSVLPTRQTAASFRE